jgi:uncharacterized protein Yka (UPF0111/DUF47 family)
MPDQEPADAIKKLAERVNELESHLQMCIDATAKLMERVQALESETDVVDAEAVD